LKLELSHRHESRVFGLDVVRALAILLIISSHSVILLAPNSESSIAFGIKFLGTIGVDVFFVLSGFLIGSILLKQINSGKTKFKDVLYFWVRRWFRTLPNYYLVLLINIIVYALFYNQVISGLWKYFLFIHNFSSAQSDFFTESWSLSIEEFAYVLIPLLLILVGFFQKKITHKTFLVVTLFSIVLITLNRFYFNSFLAQDVVNWSASLRKVVIYRLDSIYYGFIGAYVFMFYKVVWSKFKFVFALLGSVIFLGLHLYVVLNQLIPSTKLPFFNIFYLPLLSISILLFFPLVYTFQLKGFIREIITKISLWSYSLYLVNYSLVLLTLQHFILIDDLSIIQKTGILSLFWIISFGLAFLLYNFYEIPLTNLRDSNRVKCFFKTKK